jgi:hypothetical protein
MFTMKNTPIRTKMTKNMTTDACWSVVISSEYITSVLRAGARQRWHVVCNGPGTGDDRGRPRRGHVLPGLALARREHGASEAHARRRVPGPKWRARAHVGWSFACVSGVRCCWLALLPVGLVSTYERGQQAWVKEQGA